MSMRKRTLDNYKFEDTVSYSTLRTIDNAPKRAKRDVLMDRPLPEEVYTGWDETGYGGTVLADGATPSDPGYNDRPTKPPYGSVADSYWQALAASRGTPGRPRTRPVLDEEQPKPDSNANPSPTQTPPTTTNPDKPRPTTPAFVPIAAGDDAPNDSEDTYVEPLPGAAGAGENNDPDDPDLYPDKDYGQPGAAGGPENNNPTEQVPSTGSGTGANPTPSTANTQTNSIPTTACLTPEEFAEIKALIFQLSQDVRASDKEREHTAPITGPLTTTAGKADENPQSSYSKPDDNLGTNKDKDNRRKPKSKHTPKQDDKLLTKDQKDAKAGSSPKDKGLLGMGALLGSTVAFYGFMEGVSSQYVIGTGALALYCLVNTLDLQV